LGSIDLGGNSSTPVDDKMEVVVKEVLKGEMKMEGEVEEKVKV
jgi:hypothetical protein